MEADFGYPWYYAKIDVTEYLGSLYIISTFFAAIRDCPWETGSLNKTGKSVCCFWVSTLAAPTVDLPADVRLLMCLMRSSVRVLYTKVMGNERTFSLSTTGLHSSCLKEISGVSENTLQKTCESGHFEWAGHWERHATIIVESIMHINVHFVIPTSSFVCC
jgi:hypothetical protein